MAPPAPPWPVPSLFPTLEELERLPLPALAAYAARCGRRAVPVFRFSHILQENRCEVFHRVLTLAEAFCSWEEARLAGFTPALYRDAEELARSLERYFPRIAAAGRAACCAIRAADAGACVLRTSGFAGMAEAYAQQRAAEAVCSAHDAASYARSALPERDGPRLAFVCRRDFELLWEICGCRPSIAARWGQ